MAENERENDSKKENGRSCSIKNKAFKNYSVKHKFRACFIMWEEKYIKSDDEW